MLKFNSVTSQILKFHKSVKHVTIIKNHSIPISNKLKQI